jgi:hypothetical protein
MEPVETVFSGMAKRRVAKVMAKSNGFSQIFVQTQADGNGAGNLRNFKDMCEAGSVVVAGRSQKDLGFVLEAAEGLAVDDPVPVALKNCAQITGRLMMQSAPRPAAETGVRGENEQLLLFKLLTDIHG